MTKYAINRRPRLDPLTGLAAPNLPPYTQNRFLMPHKAKIDSWRTSKDRPPTLYEHLCALRTAIRNNDRNGGQQAPSRAGMRFS